jgi:hypothetical protein
MRMVQKEMATESQRHREEMKTLRNLRFFLRFLCDSVSLWPILCPNVVWFDLELGERQKALGYFNQALPIFREIGNHSGEATTLTNIGGVYLNRNL